MIFTSIGFVIFLPIVFILYWFVTNKSLKFQNILLLVVSYFFYACWDWRFLFLLIFSTFLDYFTGLKIYDAKSNKKKVFWLCLSICINLGFLGVFKYYNFFSSSFADALSLLGMKTQFWTLKVILPVGISFYTFHGLSYVLDIHFNRIKPERNFISYSVFVSFFPLLVAGPIERATHLLPQIIKKREFDYSKAVDGLRQIMWGAFKKIVIADTCAVYVNDIFSNYTQHSGSMLLLGVIYFAFQIYCDFSGYSDIALGTARLFGIELLRNFAFPYFSRDIAEFWRRWHISLSSWFRDYVYIPLGGSKGGTWMKIRNTFIIFLLSGFWHGANWTFIVWGGLNALYFLPLMLMNKNRQNLQIVAQGKFLPTVKEFFSMLLTFGLTLLAWVFFRSPSISDSIQYIGIIFSKSFFNLPSIDSMYFLIVIMIFMLVEWTNREKKHALEIENAPVVLRRAAYVAISFVVILAYSSKPVDFIYFQF